MQITKNRFRMKFYLLCLLGMVLSVVQGLDKPMLKINWCPRGNITMNETGIIISSLSCPEFCYFGLKVPPNKTLEITKSGTACATFVKDDQLKMIANNSCHQNGSVSNNDTWKINIDTDAIDCFLDVFYKTCKVGRFSIIFKLFGKPQRREPEGPIRGPPAVPTSTPRWSTKRAIEISTIQVNGIIALTVGVCVFLNIVLLVVFVKYKQRKRTLTPVDIPLEKVEIPPESLPIDEECYEVIAETEVPHTNVNGSLGCSSLNIDIDKQQHICTKRAKDDSVSCPKCSETHLNDDTRYAIPATNEPHYESIGYEVPKISPENPGYTELQGRNTTDDDNYQKLLKQDSDYVIPASERRESYQDTKMVKNLPGYMELDLSQRETEENQRSTYQTLVKT